MARFQNMCVLSCVCLFFLLSVTTAEEVTSAGGDTPIPNVSMKLGGLQITSKVVELRCEICNNSNEDIWVCSDSHFMRDPSKGIFKNMSVAEGRRLLLSGRGGYIGPGSGYPELSDGIPRHADLGVDTKNETLVVLRRMRFPTNNYVCAERFCIKYNRLPIGQRRAEVLSVSLPMYVQEGFFALGSPDREAVKNMVADRLVFELGYFTTTSLKSLAPRDERGAYSIEFSASGECVSIVAYIQDKIWNHERAARMTIEGVSIPVLDWLTFKPRIYPEDRLMPEEFLPEGQSSDMRPMGMTGGVSLHDLNCLLFRPWTCPANGPMTHQFLPEGQGSYIRPMGRIGDWLPDLSPEEKAALRHKSREALEAMELPKRTPPQMMDDLFHDFSLGLEEYRYAKRLFAVDEDVLNDVARQMMEVYLNLAQGTIELEDLSPRLDHVATPADREKVLKELEAKQPD